MRIAPTLALTGLSALLAAGAFAADPKGPPGPGSGPAAGPPGPGERGPRHGHARGHGKGPDGGRPGVCREDRQRLCPAAGDREAIRDCLLAHKAELAAPCRGVIERAEALRKDCGADTLKYCAEVPPGRGRVLACLIGRKADLQPTCRPLVDAAIAEFNQRRAAGDKPGKGERRGEPTP